MRWMLAIPLVGACAMPTVTTSSQGDPSAHDPTYDAPPAVLEQIGTDQPGVFEMALDATDLYWVLNGELGAAALRRMPRGGGAIETVATLDERLYGLALDDDAAYVTSTQGGVMRIAKADGATTVLATPTNPTKVAVEDGWVYYNEAIGYTGTVSRVPTTGGTPELIADQINNPWDLDVAEGEVFVSEMNGARILGIVPGEAPAVLYHGEYTTAIDVFGDDVYFGTSGGALHRVSRVDGEVEDLVASSSATDDSQLLVAGGGEALWSGYVMPFDGTTPTVLLNSASGPLGVPVAADANGAFTADYYSGAIYKLW